MYGLAQLSAYVEDIKKIFRIALGENHADGPIAFQTLFCIGFVCWMLHFVKERCISWFLHWKEN